MFLRLYLRSAIYSYKNDLNLYSLQILGSESEVEFTLIVYR